jgi:Lrp/AsnC family leucine-responsive transcriptional regulator
MSNEDTSRPGPDKPGDRTLKEIDLAILAELQAYARISDTDLSKKVNYSRWAVAEHIEYMEKKGVIKNYRAVINPGKFLEYSPDIPSLFLVFTEVSLRNEESRASFLKYVADTKEVVACWRATGAYSYLIHCACPDSARYGELVSEMQSAFNVGVNGHVVLSAQKQFEGYPVSLYKVRR